MKGCVFKIVVVIIIIVRRQVPKAMSVWMTAFWDIAPCSLVEVDRHLHHHHHHCHRLIKL
jgi:hypothetical protein